MGWGLLIVGLVRAAAADAEGCGLAPADAPAQVALLTTAPGDPLYTSMGHSALVFSGGGRSTPRVYNWGAFDVDQDDLLPKFFAGTLEYWLMAEPWDRMLRRVHREDRTLVAQVLDLPPESVRAMDARLKRESQPENRNYRYHWATANCATKIRDVLDGLTGGALATAWAVPHPHTARAEGFRHLAPYGPIAVLWTSLAGPYLDRPLSVWEATMVPDRLMQAVAAAQGPGGAPLVRETCTVTQGSRPFSPAPPALAPASAAVGAVFAALIVAGRRGGRPGLAGAAVAGWGLLAGALGALGFLLWVPSAVDGLGPSLLWLAAGPQTLALVALGLREARGRSGAGARRLSRALGALGLLTPVALAVAHQASYDLLPLLLPPLLAAAFVPARGPAGGPPA